MGQGDDRNELEANEIFSVRHEFLIDKQHSWRGIILCHIKWVRRTFAETNVVGQGQAVLWSQMPSDCLLP